MSDDTSQLAMLHRLPPAPLVDRLAHLRSMVDGRRVVHIGFADSGFRSMQERAGTWLHAHLATSAAELVGLDADPVGVHAAVAEGYAAHVVDCCDVAAVEALGLEPAQVVVAGEVIEHLDAPGALLEAAHPLVAADGLLVITTPNAYGWLNVAAALGLREVNHPDHVLMFTWRTLASLAQRHGWSPVATAVYVPEVKQLEAHDARGRLLGGAARAVCAAERFAARLGRPYAADGLIVALRSARRHAPQSPR